MSDLRDLAVAVREFNTEREWHQFHDPKSLALALVGEVGELAELLQWQPAAGVAHAVRSGPLHDRVAEEISDILIYLLMIADAADVDLLAAATDKLAAARARYPADEFAGRAPRRS